MEDHKIIQEKPAAPPKQKKSNLSPYELQRLQNIERNREMMINLGLDLFATVSISFLFLSLSNSLFKEFSIYK
jgi:hypothetical protein